MKNLIHSLNKKTITLVVTAAMAASSMAVYAHDKHNSYQDSGSVTATMAAAAKISIQQAMHIAKKTNAGKVISVELEKDDGKLIYKVDSISRKKNAEYELEIDANTGKILERDTEKLRKHDDKEEANAYAKAKIKLTRAMSLATAAQAGSVISAKFDVDDGKAVYEIEVAATNGNTYDIKVSPSSGAIISKTIDNDD